jgi:hypothetical protein
MSKGSWKWIFSFLFLFFAISIFIGSSKAMETKNLIARDRTGQLTEDQIRKLTLQAETALAQILAFYSTGPRNERFGKIRIEYDHSRNGTYAAVFLMRKEDGRKVRIVRIFGVTEEVQMMSHKLTHAVFPNADKLIRNMMGIPMESRFGNPITFPMCGFTCDEWVYALRQNKSYIPLEELGPEHKDWGMSTRGELPIVVDKARQHAAYAESGSFGEFLLDTYGIEKVKAFNKESIGKKRPWEAVFGGPLKEIERKWTQAIDSSQTPEGKNIPALLKLIQKDPYTACSNAQSLATAKGKK